MLMADTRNLVALYAKDMLCRTSFCPFAWIKFQIFYYYCLIDACLWHDSIRFKLGAVNTAKNLFSKTLFLLLLPLTRRVYMPILYPIAFAFDALNCNTQLIRKLKV